MECKINIDDYLSEEDKREIAKDIFRGNLAAELKNDTARIISNAAYDIVSKMCDEIMDGKLKENLRDKVTDIINNLSAFTVFDKPNAWDRDGNSNYHLLKEIVEEKRGDIEGRLNNLINNLSLPNDFKINLNEEIEDLIRVRLFGESEYR